MLRIDRTKVLLTVGAFALYAIAFVPLARLTVGAAILVVGPVLLATWFFGTRVGLAATVLSAPVNTVLYNLAGYEGWDVLLQTGGLAGTIALAGVTLVLGYLRELRRRLIDELEKHRAFERELDISDVRVQVSRQAVMGTVSGAAAQSLSNPLSVVMANLEYLRDALGEAGSQEMRDAADDAFTSAKRMLRTIQRLESLGHTGAAALTPVTYLPELMSNVTDLIRSNLHGRLRITTDLGSTPPVPVAPSELAPAVAALLLDAVVGLSGARQLDVSIYTGEDGGAMIRIAAAGQPGGLRDKSPTNRPWVSHEAVEDLGGHVQAEAEEWTVSLPIASSAH